VFTKAGVSLKTRRRSEGAEKKNNKNHIGGGGEGGKLPYLRKLRRKVNELVKGGAARK